MKIKPLQMCCNVTESHAKVCVITTTTAPLIVPLSSIFGKGIF